MRIVRYLLSAVLTKYFCIARYDTVIRISSVIYGVVFQTKRSTIDNFRAIRRTCIKVMVVSIIYTRSL